MSATDVGTVWFIVAAALALGVPVEAAAQRIHRCQGEHGEAVFSERPCAPGRDQAGKLVAAEKTLEPAPPPSCATSAEEIERRLRAAIARHDANAISGLMRWQGYGSAGIGARMLRLRELAAEPLLDLLSTGDIGTSSAGLRLRVGGTGGRELQEENFSLISDGGCFWLEW